MVVEFPPFEALPLQKSGPPGNAWGLFGDDDELGMLNLLTPETTRDAAREIREGIRIALDWPLNKPSHPTFERQRFHHAILHRAGPTFMNDDAVHMNTQSSTQWDGFRHYGYQKEKKFFNGHTQQEFESSTALGLNVWVEKGGIVGRGVLLDWASWAAENGKSLSPFQTGAVELSHLKQIVKEQDIEFKPGDILFIRSGFSAAYNKLSDAEQRAFPDREPPGLLGLEATKNVLRWIWENKFAAVGGDSPSFERGPATGPYNDPETTLHQWLLAGWGLPIGEMFDLEKLASECRRLGRYSFFLSSVPLHIPGGVASPPNAIAIL
ncbi:Putative cyclase [Glarea lozoyensis ATCC 20868]|uniref:Putative cyclase n=1 Tax=Glarea lozoyensis (strain ATCC 20868 / MF5171) TaxID=1116229 RepID=S3CPC7_GLAL2|nr:Putative cyclase [Glarea lozoyensis ATCC 20868]EPE28302.1 Putative cyclase [Glarea lozoyensis ATCC 20868]